MATKTLRIRRSTDQYLIDTEVGTWHLLWSDGDDPAVLIDPAGNRTDLVNPIYHPWARTNAEVGLAAAFRFLDLMPGLLGRPIIWCDGAGSTPDDVQHEHHAEYDDDGEVAREHYITGACYICHERFSLDANGDVPEHESQR